MVIVDLYPFEKKLNEKKKINELIEHIDIGGFTLIRSAAKNFNDVTVISSIADYSQFTKELKIFKGSTSEKFRKLMSSKAFGLTAYYDSIIANWLNDHIGIKFPEKKTIQGKLIENLRYGDSAASDETVRAALESANADFVLGLRDGLGTLLGENGQGLSGGERQRIAIARALVADPRLLILDEATSALDPRSEEAIRHTISRQHGKRTVLIVAHRLSTVLQADRIIVFDRGCILGEGSHDELISSNKLYRQFASVQNLSSAENVTLFRYGSKANETA